MCPLRFIILGLSLLIALIGVAHAMIFKAEPATEVEVHVEGDDVDEEGTKKKIPEPSEPMVIHNTQHMSTVIRSLTHKYGADGSSGQQRYHSSLDGTCGGTV